MSNFKEIFNSTIQNIGGVEGTFEGKEFSNNVESSIDEALKLLNDEALTRNNVSVDYLKGWLAEQWHSGTFNVNAKTKNKDNVWSNIPGDNRKADILFGDDKISKEAQLKYYKNPEETAKAISHPDYTGMGKVVPSDQLNDVKTAALKEAYRNQNSRPEQSKNYKDTSTNAEDHIEVDNVSSKPLSEPQAKEMAKDFKKEGKIDPDKYGLNSENFVEWSDVARQAGEAALNAAALSAAIAAAPHIYSIIKEYIDNGEIDPHKLIEHGIDILSTSSSTGLRAGVAAALTISMKTGLMGESLKHVSPMAIGLATTLAINAVGYSLKLHQGKISGNDMAYYCLRDTFILSSGMLGASIGQIIIPIPIIGALVGNLVGSTIGAVTFEQTTDLVLGICVESGWTFFGIVKQDYTVPEEVLEKAGYDIFIKKTFNVATFPITTFPVSTFKVNSLNFTPLRRGIISCRIIGYV